MNNRKLWKLMAALGLAVTFMAFLGLKYTLEAKDSAAEVTCSAHSVVVTDSTWADDFHDASGLSALENVQISTDDQLVLASDALLGSATSIPISPTLGIQSWGRLYFTATVPLSTALTVDVLDTVGEAPLMHNVPNGGSLAGIDAGTHPVLKLRATLSSTVASKTPRLDEWRLNWIPDYPNQVFLPVVGNSFEVPGPTPPPLGPAIGFTGASEESPTGKTVRFPSLRKNDNGWDSSFAIQNITAFATTLTLEFFREDGTVAYAANGIPLRPYGTYIAPLADFPLADGSYALAATATETMVGMASTRHAAGTMAIAYVMITYYDWNGSLVVSRWIDLPGDGVDCFDLEQEAWLPSPFIGAALITSEDTDIAVTIEDIDSQENYAQGYLGFDSSAGSDTIYIPRCRRVNGWQTYILVANVGSSASDVTVSYHDFDGSTGYTRIYTCLAGGKCSFPCPDGDSWIEPPPFPQNRLGSAVVSANQSELIALAMDVNISSGADVFSYPCLPVSSAVVYVPNVGGGPENWASTLSIQNPNAVPNTVTMSFYNRAGDVLYEFSEILPPYGMRQYDVAQLPGLSASYEGSAIISATTSVAVLVSKER